MSAAGKRVDVLLVERGLFESRARARAAIEAGLVTANDRQVSKPSEVFPADAGAFQEAFLNGGVTSGGQ